MPEILPDFSEVVQPIVSDNVKEMLTFTQEGDRHVYRINSSSLGIILSCARKSYYLLDQKLSAINSAPALVFGSAIHKALEVFYSEPPAGRSIPRDFNEASALMAHGHAAPSSHYLYRAIAAFCEAGAPLRGLPDLDKRSLSTGIWTLQHYFKTYIDDPYVVFTDGLGPVTERTFETEIYSSEKERIVLFGTVDVVLRHSHNGQVLPADHKTSSVIGSDFFNRLKPNHQYTGYLVGAQRVLGLDTDSFLVNAIQVKPRPVTARGTPPHFTRQVTRRSPEDIAEFIESVSWACNSFRMWKEAGHWPIGHVDACTQWGGCTFLDVCSAPSDIRPNLLAAKFKQKSPCI